MPSFFNGKRFFLTYPQCEASKDDLFAFLLARADVQYLCVARELHEDGNPHLHACVEYATIQRHDKRWLDFQGKHPNKQDPRNWNACKNYVKKDGDFVETHFEIDAFKPKLLEKVNEFEKEIDWFAWCCENKITFQFADYFWRRTKNNLSTILESEHPGKMCSSLQEFKFNPDLHSTLVIRGPSGCGKTTWAKINMPKPCLFVSHIDQLKEFKPQFHVSIIFDDVDFTHYPRTAQIHIVDFDNTRAIHCRHHIAVIPAGIYKCFTCNEWPLSDDQAVARRIRKINVIV